MLETSVDEKSVQQGSTLNRGPRDFGAHVTMFEGLPELDNARNTQRVERELLQQQEHEATYSLSPDEIRYKERPWLIRDIADAIDKGQKPDLVQVKTIFSRVLSDMTSGYFTSEDSEARVNEEIPWPKETHDLLFPQQLELRGEPWEDDYGFPGPVKPGEFAQFPSGIPDYDDTDGLQGVAFASLKDLDPDKKEEAVQWILQLSDHLPLYEGEDFLKNLMRNIHDSSNKQHLAGALLDHVYTFRADHDYSGVMEDNFYREIHTPFNELVREMNFYLQEEMLTHLASETYDTKIKTLLGLMVNRTSYPRTINTVRRLLAGTEEQNPELKQGFERIGKTLLGIGPNDTSKTFYTALHELYSAISFENYKPNIAANDQEVSMLQELIQEFQVPEKGVMVDLACGTGRIANALSPAISQSVFGIDVSEKNLATAREEQTSVTFQQRDWKNTEFPRASVDMLACIGRSLPHAEDERSLRDVLEEAAYITKPGGVFICDFPNANKGHYLEGRKRYLEILTDLGIPLEEDQEDGKSPLDKISYVIDGPDENNLYNRYVPSEAKVIGMLESVGFEVQRQTRAQIGDTEDENIYYIAIRKEKKNPEWEEARARMRRYNEPFHLGSLGSPPR